MKFRDLDNVALVHDMPQYGLKAGDRGTVIEVMPGRGMEVEFMRGGRGAAIVSVGDRDVRKIDPNENATPGRLAEVV